MAGLAQVVRRTGIERISRSGVIDAIVIGSGATGGWASEALTQAGLTVLVLDAGKYRGGLARWSTRFIERTRRVFIGAREVQNRKRGRQPIQSTCYAWEAAPDAFVDDLEHPYTTPPDKPFAWFRSRQLGGRIVIPGHGRQYYRLGPTDLHPVDGLSPPWPLEPGELDPWYALVEKRLALSGRCEGNPWVPDSEICRTLQASEAEEELMQAIGERWPQVKPMLGRFGTPPRTLEAAARTGRLFVRTGAIARRIHVDRSGAVSGVTWVDQLANREVRLDAPLVFLCASALESTRLLLLSKSSAHPGGIGASSAVLGRHLMDHLRIRLTGHGRPLRVRTMPEPGRCVYIPRLDTRDPETRLTRGFGVQVYRSSGPGGMSSFGAASFGEMLPRAENRVVLDEDRVDAFGIQTLRIECAHGEDDLRRAHDQVLALKELADLLGVRPVKVEVEPAWPGAANHECGTARMGRDPRSSVLDAHNECWEARGLFVTDGACMPSQGFQNPTLTYLALTARACEYAVGASTRNR